MVTRAELRELVREIVAAETKSEKRALGNLFSTRLDQLDKAIRQYDQIKVAQRLALLEQGHATCHARILCDYREARIRELELAAGKAGVRVEFGDWLLRAVLLLLIGGFCSLIWLYWNKN